LAGQWKTAQREPEIIRVIEESLRVPALRRQAIALAASTQDEAYSAAIQGLAKDKTAPEDLRVAAAEALGSFRSTSSRVLDDLIESARGKPSSNAVAEAAVRSVTQLNRGSADQVLGLVTALDYPLGLRREALRSLMQLPDGGSRLLKLARSGRLPDDL